VNKNVKKDLKPVVTGLRSENAENWVINQSNEVPYAEEACR